ncbi:MAG: hypothetical protein M1813_003169 [Trichoglossum hirsutum]|nr:MAG: hypothetical protein M1813_003169 [Trichoglossum hirsutum]
MAENHLTNPPPVTTAHDVGLGNVTYMGTLRELYSMLETLRRDMRADVQADMKDLERMISTRIQEAETEHTSLLGWVRTTLPFNERPIQEIQGKLTELTAENSRLTNEKLAITEEADTSKARASSLEDTNARLKEDLALQRKRVRELTQKSQRLNQIIIDSGQQESEIPDDKLASDFRDLRDLVQKAAHRYYKSVAIGRPENLSDTQMEFFSGWSQRRDGERALRVRAAFAKCLRDYIFDQPYFGLDEGRESCMRDFENDIRGKVPDLDVAEWRVRTVAAAKYLETRSNLSKTLAGKIWKFMQPVLTPLPPNMSARKADQPVIEAVDDICDKALRLLMLFRASKTEYTWKDIPAGTFVDKNDDEEIELAGSESGGKRHATDYIIFNVFGALIKTRKFVSANEVSRSVLEKAHVVVAS